MPTPFQAEVSDNNGLWDAFLFYSEQEIKYKINNPLAAGNDREAHRLKLEYLQELLKSQRKKISKPEKPTRWFLQNEIRKLKIKAKPTIWKYLLYGQLSRFLLNGIFNQQKNVQLHKEQLKSFEKSVSHEQNLVNLTTQLKQAGFAQNCDHIIQKMLQQGLNKFHIRYADVQHSTTDFVLHFTKIPGSNAYYFEKFDAAERLSWEKVNKLNNSSNWVSFTRLGHEVFSAKEAANLVNGRSICKEENLWIVFDKTNLQNSYKTIHFDLEEALHQLPLPKMNVLEKKNLINALQKGEMREVIFKFDNSTIPYRLYAHPASQTIRILDANNRVVDIKQSMQLAQQQVQKVTQILNQKENNVIQGNFRKAIR